MARLVNRWRSQLQLKFILLIAVVMLCVFGVVSVLFIQQNTAHLRKGLHDQSVAFSALATKPIGEAFLLYKDSGRIRIAQEMSGFTYLLPDVNNVTITDISGNVEFSLDPNRAHKITSEQAGEFEQVELKNAQGELATIVTPFLEDFGAHRYTIVYDISNVGVHSEVQKLIVLTIASCAIALIVLAFVTFLFIDRMFLVPILKIQQIAGAISHGDFSKHIKFNRRDQIGDLATAVDNMASSLEGDITKLEQADELKNEFIMLTSHNLRTPLTIMGGYIDLLSGMKVDPEMAKMFAAIRAAQLRLATLSEEMITIASVEGNYTGITLASQEVGPLLTEVVEEFLPLSTAKNLNFVTDIHLGTERIMMNKAYLRNALWQVLENALKFTEPSGSITLTAAAAGDNIQIAFTDTGSGIASNELERLFTKFHRGTSTLQFTYEGVGVGLYITKLLIDQHKGSINVTSEVGSGTVVTITLPIAPPAEALPAPATPEPAPAAAPAKA